MTWFWARAATGRPMLALRNQGLSKLRIGLVIRLGLRTHNQRHEEGRGKGLVLGRLGR